MPLIDGNESIEQQEKAEPVEAESEDKVLYADWWERLRRVQVHEKLADEKLLREYSNAMDLRLMKRRFINSVAGVAAYLGKSPDSDFIEDVTDVLSSINDNDKYNVNVSYYDESGEMSDKFESKLTEDFSYKKDTIEKRTRNRQDKNEQKKC